MTQAVKVKPRLTASETVNTTTQTGNTGSINFYYICGSKDKIWIDRAAYSVGDNPTPFRFTGKERDPETGLVYFGARYLDPKTSRWLSGDPAMGEYVPVAPNGDEARKHNQNLPGMGGVFNVVNLHVYHYAGNNPVKYVDPDGRNTRELTDGEWANVKDVIDYAVSILDTIIEELTRYSYGGTQSLPTVIENSARHWLGIDLSSRETAKSFAKDLEKIRSGLKSLTINDFSIDPELWNDKGFVALINIDTGHIKLDPDFFLFMNYGGLTTKLGILTHEVTHNNSVLKTNDFAYQPKPSRNLVLNSPERAYRNADNWGYFLEQYDMDRHRR